MSLRECKFRWWVIVMGHFIRMPDLKFTIEGYDLFDVWLNMTKSWAVIPNKLEANLPFLLHKPFDHSLVVAWEFDQQTVSLLSFPIAKASVKMEADFFLLFGVNIIDEAMSIIVKGSVFYQHWRSWVGLLWTMNGDHSCLFSACRDFMVGWTSWRQIPGWVRVKAP